MRRKALREDLRYGECVGLPEANGDPGIELTFLRSSDMGVDLALGMMERERGGAGVVLGAGVAGGRAWVSRACEGSSFSCKSVQLSR